MKVKIITSFSPSELENYYDSFQNSVPYVDPYSLRIESRQVTSWGKDNYCLILTVNYSDNPDEIQKILNPLLWNAQYESNCNCNCDYYQLGEDITDLANPKE